MERTIRYPAPGYVIETATERILIDTGLSPSAIANPARHYERPDLFQRISLEQEQSIAEQVDTGSLTKVVLTHLHWGHVGGLHLIPASVPLVVQRREWEASHDETSVRRNRFLPSDYVDDRREVILVSGDHDLLGDGSVELLHRPGHTPGHQSLRIGELVLAADVVHFATSLDDLRFPVFADDHTEQARSARRLREMRDGGFTVVPGHDPDILEPGALLIASDEAAFYAPDAALTAARAAPKRQQKRGSSGSTSR